MILETCLQDRFLLAGGIVWLKTFEGIVEVCVKKNFFFMLFTQLYRLPTGVFGSLEKPRLMFMLVVLLVIHPKHFSNFTSMVFEVDFTGYFLCLKHLLFCFPFIDSLRAVQTTCWFASLESISSLMQVADPFKERWWRGLMTTCPSQEELEVTGINRQGVEIAVQKDLLFWREWKVYR